MHQPPFGSRAALTFPSRDKSLSQEIALLASGIIVQHAEQLVSYCFIEAARLIKGIPDYAPSSANSDMVQIMNNGDWVEACNGSQCGPVPERSQRARFRTAIRHLGAVPRDRHRVAMAGWVRMSRLRRACAQSGQNPGPLSVLDLSPANLADRRNDLRGDQIAPAYLVPRHVPHDSDQAGDFQHRAWPASRREPAHRLENQAQTQTIHYGARCHQETDRAYRD